MLAVSNKRGGAVVACWAHNPEVGGSKPLSAMFFLLYSHQSHSLNIDAFRDCYFYMSRTQVTSLPEDTSMFQKRAAKVVHLSLYINLAVIPITGLVIGILYWLGLKSGIFIEFTVGLHELSISTMYWLIAIHVSAAIFHRFKNDGVWSSMG